MKRALLSLLFFLCCIKGFCAIGYEWVGSAAINELNYSFFYGQYTNGDVLEATVVSSNTDEFPNGSVDIPSSFTAKVTLSSRNGFFAESITVEKEWKVVKISSNAFKGRSALRSVTLPVTVKSIGSCAFDGCDGLMEVRSLIEEPFAISDDTFSKYDFSLYVPKGTKAKYQALTGWKNFGDNIVEMDEESDLKDGDLFTDFTPEGVEMTFKVISAAEKTCQVGEGIYDKAAIPQETTGKVTIPEYAKGFRVTIVGDFAFIDCDKIEELVYANTITHIGSYSCTTFGCELKNVVFPDNDGFTIGSYVYQNCDKLTKLSFPRGLKEFQGYPLYNCFNIVEFVVASDNPYYKSEEGVLSSKDGKKLLMYPPAKEGTEYHIADGVEELGEGVFSCSSLVTVTFPESVMKINRNAFEECFDLENVTLPSSLKAIPNYAFAYCRSLKRFTIPQSVESIGMYAFISTALKTIEIPSGVKSLGQRAFCSDNLTDVVSNILEPFEIDDNVFQRYDKASSQYVFTSATLHVPVGTKAKYETTAGWKNFTKIEEGGIVVPEGDVNGDNNVDVADIASIISVMADGGNDAAADVNGDGAVDVADIATVISVMATNSRMAQTVR